jgi:2-polyprenyl-3-methyl-5-hydroxy-6-metoxy-1,4-benzoquinol methylase
MECAICGEADAHRSYRVREMMFGLREEFTYRWCGGCGCLSLADPPADLSPYYPRDYYSFIQDPTRRDYRRGLRGLVFHQRDRYALTGAGVLGRLAALRYPYPHPGVSDWLRRTGTGRDSRILDVGCGRGELLYDLAGVGFRDLLGIDPYLDADLDYGGGLRVLRKTVEQVEGEFDLVLFNHSLEHIPAQLETLRAAARLLAPDGWIVIRTPVVPSHAWERYGVDWVQLDAPRHLTLHSVESLLRLAGRAGLRLEEVVHDSTEFQFVGSELYRRDLPLSTLHGGERLFKRGEMRRFRRLARRLNAEGRGDQAVFYLQARR